MCKHWQMTAPTKLSATGNRDFEQCKQLCQDIQACQVWCGRQFSRILRGIINCIHDAMVEMFLLVFFFFFLSKQTTKHDNLSYILQ